MTKEDAFYAWACGSISNKEFKSTLKVLGYTVDLRQPDKGNWLEIVRIEGGDIERIYC